MSNRFAQAIRTRTQPYLDVYRGVRMSIVGILACRSALADGAPVDVPDFRREEDRKKFKGRPGRLAGNVFGQAASAHWQRPAVACNLFHRVG